MAWRARRRVCGRRTGRRLYREILVRGGDLWGGSLLQLQRRLQRWMDGENHLDLDTQSRLLGRKE